MIDTINVRNMLRAQAAAAATKMHIALLRAATLALAIAKDRAPGKLGSTLSIRLLNQYAVRVSSSWAGATWLENGTKPHRIEPKSRVLRFVTNGETRFSRGVNHPGNKAYRFMSAGKIAGSIELYRLAREAFSQ